MEEDKMRVGNISQVGRDVIIAGRDLIKGYTPEEVAVLLAEISSTFQPKPFDGRCPYKGLAVFEEEDAGLHRSEQDAHRVHCLRMAGM